MSLFLRFAVFSTSSVYFFYHSLYYFILLLLSLPFTEALFALSLATHRHVTPASVPLNVTSHLWLRPVLLIAGQLKCEGSQWEDKYKGLQAGRGVADKGRIISLLSALLLTSKVKRDSLIKSFTVALLMLFFVCVCVCALNILFSIRYVNSHQFFLLTHIQASFLLHA